MGLNTIERGAEGGGGATKAKRVCWLVLLGVRTCSPLRRGSSTRE